MSAPTGTLLNAGDKVSIAAQQTIVVYLQGSPTAGAQVQFQIVAPDGSTTLAQPLSRLGDTPLSALVNFPGGAVAYAFQGVTSNAATFQVFALTQLGSTVSVWLFTTLGPTGPLPSNAAQEAGGNLAAIAASVAGTQIVAFPSPQSIIVSAVSGGGLALEAGNLLSLLNVCNDVHDGTNHWLTTNLGSALIPTADAVGADSQALYPAAFTAASAASIAAMSLGNLAAVGAALFDAKSLTISITNPAGNNGNITAATLNLTDTVGGVTATVAYNLANYGTVNIAPGANATFAVPLSGGLLKNMALALTIGGSVYAGNVTVQVAVRGPGGNATTLDPTKALPTGTNVLGTVTANPAAATTGGATPYTYLAAASANQDSQIVKASPGNMYSLRCYNTTTSLRYLKVYDKATGPTSADTPVMREPIQAGQSANIGGNIIGGPSVGRKFLNGISFRMTTGLADNDAGAVTANDLVLNLDYL